LVLDSTFFTFDNKIYRQKFGTPMGSPLSPIIADLVMEYIEEKSLEGLETEVAFYHRYVDDIIMAVPHHSIHKIVKVFNAQHPRLKFTLEIGGNRINFLDITITKNGNNLEYDWFHKPTFSGRFLSFMSSHPSSQKRGIITNMVDKVLRLSHPKFHEKNLNLIIKIFLDNDYPIEFIFDTIRTRVKTLAHKKPITQTNDTTINGDVDKIKWFTIPYIPIVSEQIKNMIKLHNVKLAFFSFNKLDGIIKAQKDILPNYSRKNVVYKICCKDCDASYVGQTSRKLKTRINEHCNNINWKSAKPSVITEHRLSQNHDFDWENVMILDNERFLGKSL